MDFFFTSYFTTTPDAPEEEPVPSVVPTDGNGYGNCVIA